MLDASPSLVMFEGDFDMNEHDRLAMKRFFEQVDEAGVTNARKAEENHHVIRRVPTTSKDQSYEDAADEGGRVDGLPIGVVEVEGKLVGFGIHILNEDVYPLQSFEIYLRGCDLVGDLDLSGCADVVFVDVYRNRISSVEVAGMPSLRILGLQGNELTVLDPRELPACQGIDIGMNRLESIDVSCNPELVELYVNDNRLTSIDTSHNAKLKYLRLQNNAITELDTTANPLLRHLYATGNPLKRIRALAPGGDGKRPLQLIATEGGSVGLSFNPIYNAQWKETGEWEQSYHAYPDEGFAFAGWYDENGGLASNDADWVDEYGASRILEARFSENTC